MVLQSETGVLVAEPRWTSRALEYTHTWNGARFHPGLLETLARATSHPLPGGTRPTSWYFRHPPVPYLQGGLWLLSDLRDIPRQTQRVLDSKGPLGRPGLRNRAAPSEPVNLCSPLRLH